MEIKSFDRANLKVLSMDINETLQAVGKKYGISIKTNGGTFDHISFRLKVECSVMQDGNVISKEETCFKQYASMYGMKPEDLGKNIIVGGKAYKVIGLRPSARRFPILAKRYDGKRFCLPLSSVKHALGYDVTSADFSSSSGDDGEGAWEAKVS
jgi:hypothetical protein